MAEEQEQKQNEKEKGGEKSPDFYIFERVNHTTIATNVNTTSISLPDFESETTQTFNGYHPNNDLEKPYVRTMITDNFFFSDEGRNSQNIRKIVEHFKEPHSLTDGESHYWVGSWLGGNEPRQFLNNPGAKLRVCTLLNNKL